MNIEVPRICPEAEFLLLCGRPKIGAEKTARQREILRAGLDWDYLIKSAGNHRIVPLLYRALFTAFQDLVPGDVLEKLRRGNLHNARKNILQANELIRVIESMEDQGIPVMPFKGPVLASSAYSDLLLRQFDDLDILISPTNIEKTDELLISLGYLEERQQHDSISKAQKAAMLKYQHHHHFYSPDSKVHMEVHWALSPELYSLHQDTACLWDRSERVTLLNRELKSLSLEDTLVLICDHAVRHQWSRLAWISDVAMIASSKSLRWNFVMEQAREWRAQRALLLGLFLANGLLGVPLPDDIERRVKEDQKRIALASVVVERLFPNGKASAEFLLDATQLNIQDQLFYIKARDNLSDRARLYLRLVTTPTIEDWNYFSLPDQLFSLYHLVRPWRQVNEYRLKILNWLLR